MAYETAGMAYEMVVAEDRDGSARHEAWVWAVGRATFWLAVLTAGGILTGVVSLVVAALGHHAAPAGGGG